MQMKCVSLELATKVTIPKNTYRGKHQRAPKVKPALMLALALVLSLFSTEEPM